MKSKDITGKKFGRLTPLRFSHKDKNRYLYWLFKCDCGNEKVIRKNHVYNGRIKSCGCINRTHNKTGTRLYNIYLGMKTRCYNKNRIQYKDWGGRGIKICQEWQDDFLSFYNWSMQNGYTEKLTIDRIDNDGNYEPSNCRWATYSQQNSNKRKELL